MISLLVLLPVALLFLAALGIVILQQARPSIGRAWLIGAVAGLVTLAATLFLRWRLPLHVTLEQWQPFAGLSTPPSFQLDLSTWPYVFSLVVVALSFILTDSARLETEARPLNWAVGLAIAGMGILAVMAANPITLVLTWTAVDLVEFIMVMGTSSGRRMGVQTITVFSVRVAGTLLVILAILYARSLAVPFDLSPISPSLSMFMLLASGLRLGVLPLNLPYTREVYAWRGLGNVMRMIGPASSLSVLGRMPEQAIAAEWKPLFLGFTALAAVYGAAMWLTADDERNGRPYWFIALAALAVASVINGYPRASIAWGAALILLGSQMFFFSARRKQILFIPILAALGLFGLPYTPTAPGWPGLLAGPFNFYTLLFMLTVLFLAWGYWRLSMRPRDELYRMERWVHTIYPTGLMFLVLGQWALGLLGGSGSLTVGVWWASTAMLLVAALGLVLVYTLRGRFAAGEAAEGEQGLSWRWINVFARRVGGVLSDLFRLNWLYRFIASVYQVVQGMIQLLTAMFEGDGGILWSMVMLALLISLIWTGIGGAR